jgi:hypothetical protein
MFCNLRVTAAADAIVLSAASACCAGNLAVVVKDDK